MRLICRTTEARNGVSCKDRYADRNKPPGNDAPPGNGTYNLKGAVGEMVEPEVPHERGIAVKPLFAHRCNKSVGVYVK